MKHPIHTGFAILGTVFLIGCSTGAVSTNHGHLLSNEELQQVQPGMGKEQVRMALGTPDTTSTIGGGSYYYISSKTMSGPFLDPTVKERRVAAVYFNEVGTVTRIANYGLKDGKVIDFPEIVIQVIYEGLRHQAAELARTVLYVIIKSANHQRHMQNQHLESSLDCVGNAPIGVKYRHPGLCHNGAINFMRS